MRQMEHKSSIMLAKYTSIGRMFTYNRPMISAFNYILASEKKGLSEACDRK